MLGGSINVTKKQINETHKSLFESKDGTTFTGKVPKDKTRVTNTTHISMQSSRDLQLLRHVCTHVLHYLQQMGVNPVEVQAAWVPLTGNMYITGNVGAAIHHLRDSGVRFISEIFNSVQGQITESSGSGPVFSRLHRHSAKLKRVGNGTRSFPGPSYADLSEVVMQFGSISYCDVDTTDSEEAGFESSCGIIFLLHDYRKDRNVRHAEQIILEFLNSWGASGEIAISGTKIPCFACHSEFEWWSTYLDIRYVDITGALFVNTINKNVKGKAKLNTIYNHMTGNQIVNETADVDSDSSDDGMDVDGDNF